MSTLHAATRPLVAALLVTCLGVACGGDPDDGETPGLCEAPAAGTEKVLLLNGKLASKAANYALNELSPDGHWIGSEVLVYDPSTRGALRRLGRMDYGPEDAEYDKEQMLARELAWSPTHGLWGIFVDTGFHDEWYLGRIEVPDLNGTDQRLPVTLWAFRESDMPLYMVEEITGLEFDGDVLLAGTPAMGAFPGQIFEIAGPFPPGRDDVDPYYMAENRGSVRYDLPGNLGVSGDIAAACGTVYAALIPGNDPGLHRLARLEEAVETVGAGTPLDRADRVGALAGAQGRLLGFTLDAKVYEVDPRSGRWSLFDDLDAALPPDDLGQVTRRIRGAATVVLP